MTGERGKRLYIARSIQQLCGSPILYITGTFPPAVKRPAPVVEHSLPCSAEVKNVCEAVSPLPNMPSSWVHKVGGAAHDQHCPPHMKGF